MTTFRVTGFKLAHQVMGRTSALEAITRHYKQILIMLPSQQFRGFVLTVLDMTCKLFSPVKRPLPCAVVSWFYIIWLIDLTGAEEVIRTPDLLITNQLLYRLSYPGTDSGYSVLQESCTDLIGTDPADEGIRISCA